MDKDYITNAIVYSGAFHSDNYIKILLQNFNFKITHVAYSSITNMNSLTNEVKTRLEKINKRGLADLFNPPELIQCSDITHFPKNFA